MSQTYGAPEAHDLQRPHAGMNETATWSPTARPETFGPIASITPDPSCPPIAGYIESVPKKLRTSIGAVMSPVRVCSSE